MIETSIRTSQNYLLDIFQSIYHTIGFYGSRRDSYEVKMSRPEFVYLACNLKLSDCVQKALQEFNTNIKDLSKYVYFIFSIQKFPFNKLHSKRLISFSHRIDVDLRETIFCTAAKHYNQTEVWTHLWNLYTTSIYDYEKSIIVRSFRCFEDTKILKK